MDEQEVAKKGSGLTRRGLLGAASLTAAGLAAGSLVGLPEAKASEKAAKHYAPLENFKYDLERSTGWVGKGGTAKEVTVDEFPVSQSIAGVSMRLQPGGLRELHWHAIAAEWAYVIKGNVRTTVLAPDGSAEWDDFGPGDVWYFPKGHGHALQGLGPGETHFLLAFDDGHFSEFGTFSITDWIGHAPEGILARNMKLPDPALAGLPKSERYIVAGRVPPPVPVLRNGNPVASQFSHKYRLDASNPIVFPGGEMRIVSSKEFPIQTTLTAVLLDLKPGALREMHWHPRADEWVYFQYGKARMQIFGAHGRVAVNDFEAGQVAFVQQGFGHYIQQIGDEPTRAIVLFNSPLYEEISLSTWLASNPAYLVEDNFSLTGTEVAQLPKKQLGILA
ncbi:MAG: cupin domain-containing protein [Terriglobia bacterium]